MNERRSTVLSRLGGLAPSGWRLGLAIVLALTVSAVVILVAGGSPIEAYAALLKGSIGSALAFSNTGVRATPLILTACAVGLGVKGGLWNIGWLGRNRRGPHSSSRACLASPSPRACGGFRRWCSMDTGAGLSARLSGRE